MGQGQPDVERQPNLGLSMREGATGDSGKRAHLSHPQKAAALDKAEFKSNNARQTGPPGPSIKKQKQLNLRVRD